MSISICSHGFHGCHGSHDFYVPRLRGWRSRGCGAAGALGPTVTIAHAYLREMGVIDKVWTKYGKRHASLAHPSTPGGPVGVLASEATLLQGTGRLVTVTVPKTNLTII